jgi:hypothetical protein
VECMFCGEETNSEEHVIPQWLQRRFSLRNQTVTIPNGTSLKYKHVKVPASSTHNNKFGEIENRISRGIFNLSEIYLWALKIHIGFIFRDGSLRQDIKNPSGPFILNVGDFGTEIGLFRLLCKIWLNGGSTDPSPFGSVYVFDSLSPKDTFDFFHCYVTGTFGIQIGKKYVVVFLWDQGDGLHANLLEHWNYHASAISALASDKDKEEQGYMAHHVWACETGYWLFRNRRSFNLVSTENQIVLVPPLLRTPTRPPSETEYRQICRSFGLDLVKFNGQVGNVYKQFDFDKP